MCVNDRQDKKKKNAWWRVSVNCEETVEMSGEAVWRQGEYSYVSGCVSGEGVHVVEVTLTTNDTTKSG